MSDLADKIERSRRRREDEALILLLLLSDEGRRDVAVAIKHGFPINVVLTNTFQRSIPVISGSMADAHLDALRRFEKIGGTIAPALESAGGTDVAVLTRLYEPQAQAAADAMAQTLGAAIDRVRFTEPGLSARVTARMAFDTAGYTRTNAAGLDAGTARAVTFASNVGFIAGSSADDTVTALTHISVLDTATTEICTERSGLTLPVGHPYWQWGVPPLHWGCRSIVIPRFSPQAYSQSLPAAPPAPGFGRMPAGFGF